MDESSSSCPLPYARFHTLFTLPPTLLLLLLYRPFLTSLDRAKLIILPIIAFVWTTPWDNEIVRRNAWWYRNDCVLFTIGYVPVEEYFFFLIQSVIATLFTSFLSRWLFPPIYLFPARSSSRFRRIVDAITQPSLLSTQLILAGGLVGAYAAQPNEHTYYAGMIAWWAAVPLALLCWGTANYLGRIPGRVFATTFGASVLIPSMYLWTTDIYAMRRETWHINEKTSLNIFPLPDLPVEEAAFFVATNLILVTACFAFDRCIAICRCFPALVGLVPEPPLSQTPEDSKERDQSTARKDGVRARVVTPIAPSYVPLAGQTIVALWKAFVLPDSAGATCPSGIESEAPTARLADLRTALAVLSRASRSFSAASALLPWDLRADLGTLYAFCRVGDDLVDVDDESLSSQDKRARLALLRTLLDAVYSDPTQPSKSRAAVRAAIQEIRKRQNSSTGGSSKQGTANQDAERMEELRAVACALTDLAHLVPRRNWDELLRGYALDLQIGECAPASASAASSSRSGAQDASARVREEEERRGMKDMAEVVEYAQCVAGSVGEMCVRVVLARCGVPVPLELRADDSLDPTLLSPREKPKSASAPAPSAQGTTGLDETAVRSVLGAARRMGVALQLVNIARDIVPDAALLGRCYLPRDMFEAKDAWIPDALLSRNVELPPDAAIDRPPVAPSPSSPSRVEPTERAPTPAQLRPYALALISHSAQIYSEALPFISLLPSAPARAGMRAACAVYAAIGEAVRAQSNEKVARAQRASSGTPRRVLIALRAIYSSR